MGILPLSYNYFSPFYAFDPLLPPVSSAFVDFFMEPFWLRPTPFFISSFWRPEPDFITMKWENGKGPFGSPVMTYNIPSLGITGQWPMWVNLQPINAQQANAAPSAPAATAGGAPVAGGAAPTARS